MLVAGTGIIDARTSTTRILLRSDAECRAASSISLARADSALKKRVVRRAAWPSGSPTPCSVAIPGLAEVPKIGARFSRSTGQSDLDCGEQTSMHSEIEQASRQEGMSEMPMYFFDIRTMTDLIQDLDGRFLPSRSAAIEDAKRDALGLAADYLRSPQGLPPEAILLRDDQRRILHVVTLKEVSCEALDGAQRHSTGAKQTSGLAIVVAHEQDEWFAASLAFQRRGYLVHSAGTLEDAVEKLKEMGAAHPLLRQKCPIIFASLDKTEPPLDVLRAARAACPTVWVLLASNAQSRVIFLPRRSTPRQIEDLLFWPEM